MLHFQLVDGLGRVRRCGLCWRRCVTGAGFEVSRTYATSSMFSASCLLLDTRALQLLLLLAFAMPSPSIETLSFRNFLGMMSCHSIGKVTKAVSKQKKQGRSQDSKVLCDASCTGDCPRRDIQEGKGCYLIEGIAPFLSPVLEYLGFLRQVGT